MSDTIEKSARKIISQMEADGLTVHQLDKTFFRAREIAQKETLIRVHGREHEGVGEAVEPSGQPSDVSGQDG